MKIKLKDRKKYCLDCKEMVEIVIVDLNGFCPNDGCGIQLFTLDTRPEHNKRRRRLK